MIHSLYVRFGKLASESSWRKDMTATDLTAREIEILNLISSHLANKQIAKRLRVSTYTVKNHVHNILEKLRVHSRAEAVDYARQRQWLHEVRYDSQ
jgi:DNA-binding NarL/FixJ family response regulator